MADQFEYPQLFFFSLDKTWVDKNRKYNKHSHIGFAY